MKTIAFFIRNMDQSKPPFSSMKYGYNYFGMAYQEYLLQLNRQPGVQAFFVTGNDSYLGKGRFARAWSIDKVGEVKDFTPAGAITAGVVFDKGGFEGTDITMVTDPMIRDLCDKAATYQRFGRFQPQTVICQTEAELRAAMADLPGDLAVVKNPGGDSGTQVYIGRKGELKVPADETYPLIVQEFVDMSEGVPGLAEGLHDLRILSTGNVIIGGTIRQPAPGKLHANTGQGGTERLLAVEELPAEARAIADEINRDLGATPRYYSMDFARGKQGWRLIELNSKPGLYRDEDGPLAAVFRSRLVDYLVSLA